MQRMLIPGLLVAATVAHAAVRPATEEGDAARRCTMLPGAARAVVHIERDTMMPFTASAQQALSYSAARSPDSMLATAETLMPSARVRVLQLDSASRAVLTGAGITDARPRVYIQAAPYRSDCRTIRWTDSASWTQAGDTGFVVATLVPRERWISGVPMFVIADAWSYPYPRNAIRNPYSPIPAPHASPDAMFSFEVRVSNAPDWQAHDKDSADAIIARTVAWARDNVEQRERDPIRSRIRNIISAADFSRIAGRPSRFSGTYRVELRSGDTVATWQFRTVDRPAYAWLGLTTPSSADLIAAPFVPGYRLVAYGADTAGILPTDGRGGTAERRLVWLCVTDQPSATGNAGRTVLAGMLEFRRIGAPSSVWDALDAYVPSLSPLDSTFLARARVTRTRGDDQPRLPLTLQLGRDGSIRGDTTLLRNGSRLRVTLTRVDTVSVKRPF